MESDRELHEMMERCRELARAEGHEFVVLQAETGVYQATRADYVERSRKNAARRGHTLTVVGRARP